MRFFLFILFISTHFFAQDYVTTIQKDRIKKDEYLKTAKESPFKTSRLKKNFKGLKYFSANEKYKVKAKLEFTFNSPITYIQNTSGNREAYQKYALAYFTIDGVKLQLSIYQNLALKNKKEYGNYLFIPFTDYTNGKSTYGSGRYIDTKIPKEYTGYITIDFNKAYNPYCAYNKDYTCPIPPRNNHLNIDILAGEKSY